MKKILVVLLAVAMIFAFSASVLAAPTDLADQSVEVRDAFNKFLAYGFLEGYDDGTVRPGNEITRAEFAKVICVMTGNTAFANSVMNMSSRYSDVAAGQWYTGWINAASQFEYLKGYTDGTFKPNAFITNQEIVTVFLRTLGYTDALPGAWPYDYLAQASQLQLLSVVPNFDSAANSLRSAVVLLGNALFDKNLSVVAYSTDKNAFEARLNGTVPYNMSSYYNSVGDTGEYTAGAWAYNPNNGVYSVYLNGTRYEVLSSCEVSGGNTIFSIQGMQVRGTLTSDDKLAYINVIGSSVTTNTSGNGYTSAFTAQGLKVGNAVYSYPADTALDTQSEFKANVDAAIKAIDDAANNDYQVKYFADKNSQLIGYEVLVYGEKANAAAVVSEIRNGAPVRAGINFSTSTFGSLASASDLRDENVLVLVDGAVATMADVKANYYIMQFNDFNGYDYVFKAISPTTGVLDSYLGSPDISRYTLSGSNKTVTSTTTPSAKVGTGSWNTLNSTYIEDNNLIGQEAVAVRDNGGRFVALAFGASGTSTTVVGLITNSTLTTSSTVVGGSLSSTLTGISSLTLFTQDGDSRTFNIQNNGRDIDTINEDPDNGSVLSLIDMLDSTSYGSINGQFVRLTLNDAGLVTGLAILAENVNYKANTYNGTTSVAASTSNRTIQTTQGPALVNSSTQIFSVTRSTTTNAYSGATLKTFDSVVSGNEVEGAGIYVIAQNGIARQILIIGGTATTTTFGVVESKEYNGNLLKLRGNNTTYKQSGAWNTAAVGDVVSYTVSGDTATFGEIVFAARSTVFDVDGDGSDATVINAVQVGDSTGVIALAAASHVYNADTVFYVYTRNTNNTAEVPGDDYYSFDSIGSTDDLAVDMNAYFFYDDADDDSPVNGDHWESTGSGPVNIVILYATPAGVTPVTGD